MRSWHEGKPVGGAVLPVCGMARSRNWDDGKSDKADLLHGMTGLVNRASLISGLWLLQPHFLFNTLHAIGVLMMRDAATARMTFVFAHPSRTSSRISQNRSRAFPLPLSCAP
ncbi:MAG: hypothetical protein SF097_06010 [Acidobacteriota bacterium]|nr:hypothetical protein [Acidobacteriota bacterium]